MKMSSWVSSQRLVRAAGLDAEQLLLVVPLVERPRLVETLVALQPDQVGARRARHRLGQLGLADPGRPLDQQRLLQRAREVGRRRGGAVSEVAGCRADASLASSGLLNQVTRREPRRR